MSKTERLVQRVKIARPFTEGEAWWLFRAAAFAEAIGWTLLIIAVAARHFDWSWYSYAIPIAGRIHGTFFITYFLISLAVSTSLRWPVWQFSLSVVSGVPPYGSLFFEQITAYRRRRSARIQWCRLQYLGWLIRQADRATGTISST